MRLASALGILALFATPVMAAPSAYDRALVGLFADTCLKERMDFAASKFSAEAGGWVAATADANPELAALIAFSNAAANDIKLNNGEFDFAIYSKAVDGGARYLVLS